MDAQEIWRRKTDEEVVAAARQIDDYTVDGQAIIRRELERRKSPDYLREQRQLNAGDAENGEPRQTSLFLRLLAALFGWKPSQGVNVHQSVERLVAIFSRGEPRNGSPEEAEVRQIGEVLNAAGGKPLMLAAWEQFAARNYHMKRSLERMWGGSGDWWG